jgi:hypothetical protein
MTTVILIVLRQAQRRKGILATVQIGVPKGQLNIDMIVRGSGTRDVCHILHGCVNVRTTIERTSILDSWITRGLLIVNAFYLIKGEHSTDDWGTLNWMSRW